MEYLTNLVSTMLNNLPAHPLWALVLIFGVSLGEALLVIGLFVPSTVVLVTAGTLVGAGKLPFWPVLGATVLGCIIGDQLSFWAGRWYGERLKTMWPLNRFPQLLAKGEEYVRVHGGKSIAIGRFIPGIKAVVPGIAGMFGMSQTFFLTVNLISGTAWGAAHVLPGIVLGHALAFAGDLSSHLLFALLVLFAILAVLGWLVRLIAGLVDPHRHAVLNYFSSLAQTSRFAPIRRFGKVLSPENPNSILMVFGMMAGVLAIVGLTDSVSGLLVHRSVGEFDHSLFNFFAELRSVPGDELFIRLSMLGDEKVLYGVAAVPVLWLALQRNWRASATIISAIALAKLILVGFIIALPPQGLGAHTIDFQFPSGHALMAGTVFGTVGICCARGLSRWSQALLISSFAMLVVAIAFSRLYLGVSWFSDVFGGLLIASIIVVMFSIAISTVDFSRVPSLLLLSTALVVFIISGVSNISNNFEKQLESYQPVNRLVSYPMADYLQRGWNNLPAKRINLMGHPMDEFFVQWVGPLPVLQEVLAGQHFTQWGKWGWRELLPYLNASAKISEIAPRPLVHAGLQAKMTAAMISPKDADQRFVLRAFQSNVVIAGDGKLSRVYLLTLRQEGAHDNMGLYTLPADHPPSAEDSATIIESLRTNPAIETLDVKQSDGQQIVILKPKS